MRRKTRTNLKTKERAKPSFQTIKMSAMTTTLATAKKKKTVRLKMGRKEMKRVRLKTRRVLTKRRKRVKEMIAMISKCLMKAAATTTTKMTTKTSTTTAKTLNFVEALETPL